MINAIKADMKYTKILCSGKILVAPLKIIEGIITKNDELRELTDQSNRKFFDSLSNIARWGATQPSNDEQVIAKLYYDNNFYKKRILYWAPCNADYLLRIIGIEFENGKIDHCNFVPRENQISFLGKDIKKAFSKGTSCNDDIIDRFMKRYIYNAHTIADNCFYTLYIRQDKNCTDIRCSRDIQLSPRNPKYATSDGRRLELEPDPV